MVAYNNAANARFLIRARAARTFDCSAMVSCCAGVSPSLLVLQCYRAGASIAVLYVCMFDCVFDCVFEGGPCEACESWAPYGVEAWEAVEGVRRCRTVGSRRRSSVIVGVKVRRRRLRRLCSGQGLGVQAHAQECARGLVGVQLCKAVHLSQSGVSIDRLSGNQGSTVRFPGHQQQEQQQEQQLPRGSRTHTTRRDKRSDKNTRSGAA